jgi:hypothetical protein
MGSGTEVDPSDRLASGQRWQAGCSRWGGCGRPAGGGGETSGSGPGCDQRGCWTSASGMAFSELCVVGYCDEVALMVVHHRIHVVNIIVQSMVHDRDTGAKAGQ